MGAANNAKLYRVNLISKKRNDYIASRLKWFIELLGLKITDWPLNCFELLERVKALPDMTFEYGFQDMPDKCDAMTQYIREHDLYLMVLNQNKANYPFQSSQDRRLSFTIAHELAHMALEHLDMPRDLKSEEQIALEELEADEFAARFLMPDKLLFSCNYYSLDSAASYFNVSKSALLIRLKNIERLDLLHSRREHACPICGNTRFSFFAQYCGICGTLIDRNIKGIQRIYYPETIQLDRYKRVLQCPLCGSKQLSGDKCIICGTYIFNYCTDFLKGTGDCTYTNPGNFRYCEMCGKETYFYKRWLLRKWNEELGEGEIM